MIFYAVFAGLLNFLLLAAGSYVFEAITKVNNGSFEFLLIFGGIGSLAVVAWVYKMPSQSAWSSGWKSWGKLVGRNLLLIFLPAPRVASLAIIAWFLVAEFLTFMLAAALLSFVKPARPTTEITP